MEKCRGVNTVKGKVTDGSDGLDEKYNAQLNLDSQRVEDELTLVKLKTQWPHGLIVGDLYGYITDVNDAILRMYGGGDKSEFVGKHVLKFTAKSDKQRAVDESLKSVQTGQGRISRYLAVRKSGEEFPVEVTVDFICDENGQRVGFVDYIRELSSEE